MPSSNKGVKNEIVPKPKECALNGPSGLKYFPGGIYRALVGVRVRLSVGRYVWDSMAPPPTRRAPSSS